MDAGDGRAADGAGAHIGGGRAARLGVPGQEQHWRPMTVAGDVSWHMPAACRTATRMAVMVDTCGWGVQ